MLTRFLGVIAAAMVMVPAMEAGAPTRPANGPREVDPGWHCLTHATVHAEPGVVIEDATIVVRDGVIVSVVAGGDALRARGFGTARACTCIRGWSSRTRRLRRRRLKRAHRVRTG